MCYSNSILRVEGSEHNVQTQHNTIDFYTIGTSDSARGCVHELCGVRVLRLGAMLTRNFKRGIKNCCKKV